MNKIIIAILSLLVGLLMGCEEQRSSEANAMIDDAADSAAVAAQTTVQSDSSLVFWSMTDSIAKLKFDEVSLEISKLLIEGEYNESIIIDGDSMNVFMEMSTNLQGQAIAVLTSELTDIQLFQSYETSVTIMNEGPHCDLLDWKHYRSDWEELTRNCFGDFIAASYDESERQKFVEVSLTELKEAIAFYCDEEWAKHAASVKGPNDYPAGVSINKYFLKLTGKNEKTGKQVTKIISFGAAMGC
jgi:hypothetical protein